MTAFDVGHVLAAGGARRSSGRTRRACVWRAATGRLSVPGSGRQGSHTDFL